MRRFCKAYLVKEFKKYPGWKINTNNLRKISQMKNGREEKVPRPISDNDILYLHDNWVVTDGIWPDEYIVFQEITSEWKKFCQEVLKFRVPSQSQDNFVSR